MIYSLAILDAARRGDPEVKIPPNARQRLTEIGLSVPGIRQKIIEFWARFRVENPNEEAYIQMDIIEGRKPAGFSAAAKAGELGQDVHVTRKTRSIIV